MKYKGFTISDKIIDEMMEKDKELSLADACDLYLYDKGLIDNEEANELTATANKNRITQTIHEAKETTERKKTTRVKKENPLKQEIIEIIFTSLQNKLIEHRDFSFINVTNNEKYIDFTIGKRTFTVNLIEHRGKKNELIDK